MILPRRPFLFSCGIGILALSGCHMQQPRNSIPQPLGPLLRDACDDLYLISAVLGLMRKSSPKNHKSATMTNGDTAMNNTSLEKKLTIIQATRQEHYNYLKQKTGNSTPMASSLPSQPLLSQKHLIDNTIRNTIKSAISAPKTTHIDVKHRLLQSASHAQELALNSNGEVGGIAASIAACCTALTEVLLDGQ